MNISARLHQAALAVALVGVGLAVRDDDELAVAQVGARPLGQLLARGARRPFAALPLANGRAVECGANAVCLLHCLPPHG